MVMSRGMIKLSKNKNSSDMTIQDVVSGTGDAISEAIPYFTAFWDWLIGTSNDDSDRENNDKSQSFWTQNVGGEYMFYGEDVQLIYHGKDTETYQTASGGTTQTQTNAEAYRELKFKTTISPRDFDLAQDKNGTLVSAWSGSGHNSDWVNLNPQKYMEDYLGKRQYFLTDLLNSNDDGTTTVHISSSLFLPMDAKLIDYNYTVPSGQQETVYELYFKEITNLETTANTTGESTAVEPGTASVPKQRSSMPGILDSWGIN